MSRIWVGAAFLVLALVPLLGQSRASDGRALISSWLTRSDVVVIGTLRISKWRYPWFDGWHYSGHIDVQERLSGDGSNTLALRWIERYNARKAAATACPHLTSDDDGQSGIWLLSGREGSFTLSGFESAWCNGPLPVAIRPSIVNAIRQNDKATGQKFP